MLSKKIALRSMSMVFALFCSSAVLAEATTVLPDGILQGGIVADDGTVELVPVETDAVPDSEDDDGVSIASELATPTINFSGMKAVMVDEGLTKLLTKVSPGQKVWFGTLLSKPLGQLVKNCPKSIKGKVFAQAFAFSGALTGKVPPVKFPAFKGVAAECKFQAPVVGKFAIPTGAKPGAFKVQVTNTLTGFRATNNKATGAFSVVGKR